MYLTHKFPENVPQEDQNIWNTNFYLFPVFFCFFFYFSFISLFIFGEREIDVMCNAKSIVKFMLGQNTSYQIAGKSLIHSSKHL